ncbi:MAG: adenylyltransferase/cytidyltransferase family protein [Chloroflexi bacterium]|nr:adenylyltransferase/cytidyltransferase family protein [Chloroflexota bacterium]
MRSRFGMIHGRFQPFHRGHLEYMKAAFERCDNLIVAITNPDPTVIRQEAAAEHRHLPEANPFTFFQRQIMIRETAKDESLPLERIVFIPFPINLPELWRFYVPTSVVQYIRVFSEWEEQKAQRFREQGYPVEVLHPGAVKEVEASEVRRRLQSDEDWESLVPEAVARVIREVQAGAL